jgi:prenyl protein peptidase
VLPFYLFRSTRPSPTLNRDAPSVIRARIRTVSLACLISSLATLYLITTSTRSNTAIHEALHLLGYWPLAPLLATLINPLLLTFLLFLGPLYEKIIVESNWRHWFSATSPSSLTTTVSSWIGYRNYIAGPVTEEILFRSVLIPLHLLAKISAAKIVFLTPLYFGIAHVHHYYEFRLTHPHTAVLPAVLRSVFQFTYTTLFGWYAAFLYLRTGSLMLVVLVHSFCNWCGLPRFWGRVEIEVGEPLGPPVDVVNGHGARKDDDDSDRGGVAERVQVGGGELGIGWTVVYYVLLVGGAYGFCKQLWNLTASSNALASFGKK